MDYIYTHRKMFRSKDRDTDRGSDVRSVGVASPAGGTVITRKEVFAGVLIQQ